MTKAWGVRGIFQSFWLFTAENAARAFFREWLSKAKACALQPITKVATMLANHLSGLLSNIKHRVTNAVTKGFNLKIQMIKSCAAASAPSEATASLYNSTAGNSNSTHNKRRRIKSKR